MTLPANRSAPVQALYPKDLLYAISTSGPHAYRLCRGDDFPNPKYIKKAEFRKWETKLRDVIILLHVYTSNRCDHLFERCGIDPALAPKSSIIGAAAIVDCLWEPELRQFAHIYSQPVLFDQPITGVSGKNKYWQPQPNEPHLIEAFNQAWQDLNEEDEEGEADAP